MYNALVEKIANSHTHTHTHEHYTMSLLILHEVHCTMHSALG